MVAKNVAAATHLTDARSFIEFEAFVVNRTMVFVSLGMNCAVWACLNKVLKCLTLTLVASQLGFQTTMAK